jgi:alpha-ribazole phosphatase
MTRVMAQKLIFVRHGCAQGAKPGTFVGRTDLPLSPEGIEQARKLAPAIAAARPAACYCSPLLRARQTGEILLKNTRLALQIDDDLREIDFGRWECKTFEEITAADAGSVKRWAAFDHRFAFPGGESLGGFLARVRRSARRLSEDPAASVLVVTHGGIIRAMICHFLGLRPRQYVLFHIAHAACTVIDLYDGHGVLGGLNVPCISTTKTT